MLIVDLPHNWQPRDYQQPAWEYFKNGGRHAELIWHRRSGKDEVALHHAACAAFERQATYWHMLPLATQARKAIWNAINPHTGIRRIDEAFPHELRENVNEQEMFIRFKNGSTWQVVGSDNFNAMVGSPPAGIVYSEWALANPAARAYLRPILAENNGWQMFITTPRGRNHAHQTLKAAEKQPGAFTQILTALDTGIFTPSQLDAERSAYMDEFGVDMGQALFEQEYMCSFDAAILGAYYGRELSDARQEGRITSVPYDPELEVFATFDIGWSDDTAIWFFQIIRNEIHVIDFYASHGQTIRHYADVLNDKKYKYPKMGDFPYILLPHDARAKTLAAEGKSTQQQFEEYGYRSLIVPNLSLQDGIQAARKTFPLCYFDEVKCAEGLDALSQYQREWDDDKRQFRDKPRHDWTSHAADSFRYLAIAYRMPKVEPIRDKGQITSINDVTLDTLWKNKPTQTNRI